MPVDPDHPLLRPLWVRLIAAALPLGWSIFEIATGNPFWALVFAAAGAVLFRALILRGPDRR